MQRDIDRFLRAPSLLNLTRLPLLENADELLHLLLNLNSDEYYEVAYEARKILQEGFFDKDFYGAIIDKYTESGFWRLLLAVSVSFDKDLVVDKQVSKDDALEVAEMYLDQINRSRELVDLFQKLLGGDLDGKLRYKKFNLEFGRDLGSGVQGNVFEGEVDGRAVALKEFEKFNRKEIFREYAIGKFLGRTCPFFAKVYDLIYQDEEDMEPRWILVMELVPGVPLSKYLGVGWQKLEPYKLHRILDWIFTGVACMQKHDICHLDIHVDNIIISNEKLSIIDYGTAQLGKYFNCADDINIIFEQLMYDYLNQKWVQKYPEGEGILLLIQDITTNDEHGYEKASDILEYLDGLPTANK